MPATGTPLIRLTDVEAGNERQSRALAECPHNIIGHPTVISAEDGARMIKTDTRCPPKVTGMVLPISQQCEVNITFFVLIGEYSGQCDKNTTCRRDRVEEINEPYSTDTRPGEMGGRGGRHFPRSAIQLYQPQYWWLTLKCCSIPLKTRFAMVSASQTSCTSPIAYNRSYIA